MIPGASTHTGQGHKTLAAIVFTDVVGFAHHANTDEQLALACLQRDMGIMRDVCSRTSGNVLKTMGDGMLMRFPSANQALQCALEIQRIFHEQSKRVGPNEILWHRIGVHLGDVVTTNDDVYGDGVNVAARLQAEAKPGSIFLSRTVYDVVNGKMKLPAIYVGPRHLKGIAEPVAVWEVPPLGRQELQKRQEALMAMNPLTSDGSRGIRGPGAILLIALCFVLLTAAGAMLFHGMAHGEADSTVPPGHGTVKPLLQRPEVHSNVPDAKTETKKDPTIDRSNPLADAALVAKLKEMLSRDDFAGMLAAMEASPYADSPAGKRMIERYKRLTAFMAWFGEQISTVDADHAMTLTADPAHNGAPSTFYGTRAGYVEIKTPSSSAEKEISQLPPAELVDFASVMMDFTGATDVISRNELLEDTRLLLAEPKTLAGD